MGLLDKLKAMVAAPSPAPLATGGGIGPVHVPVGMLPLPPDPPPAAILAAPIPPVQPLTPAPLKRVQRAYMLYRPTSPTPYYVGNGGWEASLENAFSYPSIAQAMTIANSLHLGGVEVRFKPAAPSDT